MLILRMLLYRELHIPIPYGIMGSSKAIRDAERRYTGVTRDVTRQTYPIMTIEYTPVANQGNQTDKR